MALLDAIWLPVMVVYGTVVAVFFCVGVNLLYLVFIAWRRPPPYANPPPLRDYPRVTVQLPIFNELYVIDRLIRAACELDWPRERFEVQVLDDSTDETQFVAARLVRQYAQAGINITHVRRPDRVGFKAGALEAGLAKAHGELIAIFDADFVPPRDFLRQTIPYFGFEQVGFVQTRWGHLNQPYSLLTELQSVIIDAHFLVDQVARNRGGYFMNFNGTAGVWRRAAIVDAGGWEHDTLAEDLDLSYRAQLRGWQAVYLPNVVTFAELPVSVSAYRAQQRRWASGSFACAVKLLPALLRARLSIGTKIQGTLHLLGYMSHACLLLMLLLQPFLLYYSQRFPHGLTGFSPGPGVPPVWLLLGILPALAPAVYFGFAQWRAGSSPVRRIPYLFGASILGPGIMLTVVGGIFRGLATKKVVFERTPKYGIARSTDSWDDKRYGLGLDPAVGLEMLLACFGLATAIYAATTSSWSNLLFAFYFLLGLLVMIGTSLLQTAMPILPRVQATSALGNREP